MVRKKSFCCVTPKVYGGKPGDKTLVIHFNARDRLQAIKLARAVFQAVAYGKGIDLTVFTSKPLKTGLVKVTVTAHK